jgi:hypothetical protein
MFVILKIKFVCTNDKLILQVVVAGNISRADLLQDCFVSDLGIGLRSFLHTHLCAPTDASSSNTQRDWPVREALRPPEQFAGTNLDIYDIWPLRNLMAGRNYAGTRPRTDQRAPTKISKAQI